MITDFSDLQKAEEQFTFNSELSFKLAAEIAREMVQAMNENKLVGIASNVLEYPFRAIAISSTPNIVMFNPRIVHESEELIKLEETDFLFPGVIVNIIRPRHIRIRFSLPNGHIQTNVYSGLTAREIQKQVDTLDRISFLEKANWFERSRALRKFRILRKKLFKS